MEHQATIPRPASNLKLYKSVVEGKFEHITEIDLQPHLESTSPKDTILHFAVKLEQIECIKEIISLCPSLLRCQNSKGDTALHIAARNGLDKIVKVLINPAKPRTGTSGDIEGGSRKVEYEATQVKSLIEMENKKKDTALHEAVRNHRLYNGKRKENYLKVLRLLTHEVGPEYECVANDAGETPLYLAAEEGLLEFVRQILEACPSSKYGGPYGRTALHAALFGRHEDIVEILLERMPDLIRKADNDKRTPLHFAAIYASPGIVEKFLYSEISIAYEADKDGILPVHLAAESGQEKNFFMFFKHCPDCFEYVDNRGWNALHFAAAGAGAVILRRVLISGDNYLLQKMANEADNDGNTPLLVAVKLCGPLELDQILSSGIVDKFAVNNDCLEAVDIIDMEKDPLNRFFWTTTKKYYWRGLPARKLWRQKFHEENKKPGYGEIQENKQSQDSEDDKERQERNGIHLLVATLVATVTFAAGFTMPGGYNDDDGTAKLATKAAFQAFVILNSLSMSSALAAVFLHFSSTLYPRFLLADFLPATSARLIMFACIEMVAAFMAGTFVVLRSSHILAVSVCCICGIFYLFVVICLVLKYIFPILLMLCRGLIWFVDWISRFVEKLEKMSTNDNEEQKKKVSEEML